ncbi:MAG: glycosyltransferase family 4 protein [Candidatus Zixiibacteriota bacterium]|nr:MAG: glycosyltransferase family 4 protein [candidate division Zixibacteria bacterium]
MIHIDGKGFPPDIRIQKEADALTSQGFEVYVLTLKSNQTQPAFEQLCPNLFTRRIDRVSPFLLSKLLSKFTLITPSYCQEIVDFVSDYRLRALHVHDFKFVPTVLMAARRFNIPVIADLHENMPAALRAYRSGSPPAEKLKRYVLDNDRIWRYHERRYLPQCDRVIVVVPEAVERLSSYGIPESKVKIVSNTEDESTFEFDPADFNKEIIEKYASQWVVSYIGGIGPHRGIDTVLAGVPLARSEIENFRLVIVGATGNQKQALERVAAKLGIEDSVEIIGWQPFDKVNSYVLASQVCLVPHNDFEHTQTTVPHKLFQYMICGKPVLVSDCRPLARIVGDTDAGYIFRANDATDFARRLTHIHRHPEQAHAKGQSGRLAALGPYAWRHDAARLVEMYTDLFDLKREVLRV